MTPLRQKNLGFMLMVVFALLSAACHKNVAAAPPPPPPRVAVDTAAPGGVAPTITLRAQPATIDRGGSTTLQWEARNAATVTIAPGVGDVPLTGNRAVSPQSSVTYTATATGPGGQAGDTARVTVNVPAAPAAQPAPARTPNVTTEELFSRNVKDVLFDYDKAEIKSDQMSVLQADAAWLKNNPNVRFTIEGHCDERGSEEYNLGLGDRRANSIKEYLLAQGLPAARMNTVSYGEEKPICREMTEDCYARNRRAAFTLNQ
jgi:peptidoglycan-associated lipoprotein